MSYDLTVKIESYLYYSGEPESFNDIAKICNVNKNDIVEALHDLSTQLEGRGVSLIIHSDTVQLVITKECSDFISRIRENDVDTNLTDAQAEALSVVAYLAPVPKIILDFIRGVNSRAVLRNLSRRGLVSSSNKDSIRYFTITSEVLAHLGITHLDDLPEYDETREKLQEFVNSDSAMEKFNDSNL